MGPLNPVYLAGATGYIGSTFYKALHRTHQIVPIVRDSQPLTTLKPRPSQALDYSELESCRFPGANGVLVHLIGSGRENQLGAILNANVTSTKKLIDFSQRNNLTRIVYLSGYGVTNTTTDPYYRAKHLAESLIQGSGLPFNILRCSYIVGGNDEFLPSILKQAPTGRVTVPGSGSYRIQPVHVSDLVEILRSVCDGNAPHNNVVDVLGEPVTYAQFVRDIARAYGFEVEIEHRALETYIRQATFSNDPEFSISELAILLADNVGPASESVFGEPLRDYSSIIRTIRE